MEQENATAAASSTASWMKKNEPGTQENRRIQPRVEWYSVSRRRQLYFEVPQILIILGVIALSLALTTEGKLIWSGQPLMPPCPSKAVLGIPCPSCGLTTCFILMSRGQLRQAFSAHYFGPFLYAGMIGYLLLQITFLVRGKRLNLNVPWWTPYAAMITTIILYLASWGIRLLVMFVLRKP